MGVWNPQDYHKHSSEQRKWAKELLGKLALLGNERVLDIGCGDGKVTAEIARKVPRGSVLGIDNSQEMLDFAAGNHPPSDLHNLRFELKDTRRLDYADEFDVVFSNATLHWVVDHRPVLLGIARALKHGGRMLLQMGGQGNAADVVAVLDEMIAGALWRGYFRSFKFPYGFHQSESYRQWLVDAGLEPLRVELVPKEMVHAGPPGLAAWIRTTWMPYTHRIPELLRQRFIDEIVATYLADHPLGPDRNVRLRMVRLEVEARKPG